MIQVNTYRFFNLYERFPNLVVPDYQRAYTWDVAKVQELLQDWEEYTASSPKQTYYMGSVLLFANTKDANFQIIDGQQRLTTLALIYYQLYGSLLKGQNVQYNQSVSGFNIAKNLNFAKQSIARLEKLKDSEIFHKLEFTVIVSDNQDHAFAFFDSQNNRGISLGVDDYLKAYHLRALPEKLQEQKAKSWEDITFKARKEDNHLLDLKHLFNEILFKVRQWKGQSHFPYPNKTEVLTEFQKNTYSTETKNAFRLFPNNNNMRYHQLEYTDNGVQLVSAEKPLAKKDYPFAIRQPIYKGQNFFDYTDKYHAIFRFLFNTKEQQSLEIEKALLFYNALYTKDMSEYLRYYMQMCLVAYYDNFKEEQFFKAIQYFDYYLGAIRLEKYYVRQEAIKNSLKNASNSLLDVICSAYLPNEVFSFINQAKPTENIYINNGFLNGKKEVKNNVIDRYIERLCEYYNKDVDNRLIEVKSRKQWIA